MSGDDPIDVEAKEGGEPVEGKEGDESEEVTAVVSSEPTETFALLTPLLVGRVVMGSVAAEDGEGEEAPVAGLTTKAAEVTKSLAALGFEIVDSRSATISAAEAKLLLAALADYPEHYEPLVSLCASAPVVFVRLSKIDALNALKDEAKAINGIHGVGAMIPAASAEDAARCVSCSRCCCFARLRICFASK